MGVLSGGETAATLETFWRNVWLRGPMFFDATGAFGVTAYAQPDTLLPFGRSFIVSDDEVVVLAGLTYDPDTAIAAIDALLADG